MDIHQLFPPLIRESLLIRGGKVGVRDFQPNLLRILPGFSSKSEIPSNKGRKQLMDTSGIDAKKTPPLVEKTPPLVFGLSAKRGVFLGFGPKARKFSRILNGFAVENASEMLPKHCFCIGKSCLGLWEDTVRELLYILICQ